ncbi:M50 family metallopeptidase [Virgisporangium aliadipatigenens]|nr:M50 family metallopeptidase [Virgisporangium aliadipatigenens]
MSQRERRSPRRGAALLGRRGVRLGHVLGFPLYLSPSWLLLAFAVTFVYGESLRADRPDLPAAGGYALGLAFVGSLVLSVLLHELGHALAGRRLGIGVRAITLELLGGYTEMEGDAPRPRVEALVSLAGPAASLLLTLAAGAAAAAVPRDTLAGQFLVQVAVSNAIITVFNALPGLPLDGGRALHALIWAGTGDPHRGREVAGRAGQVLAGGCVVGGWALYQVSALSLIGIVFTVIVAGSIWFGATGAVRLGRAGRRLHLVDVDRLARPLYRVPSGTALAEAERRAAADGAPGAALVVVGPDDRVRAVVHEAAADAVPPERRDWVAVDDVARGLDPARTLPAGTRGSDVLKAVQADPVGEYLVTAGEDVVGILRVADLARVLEPGAPKPGKSG